LTNVNGTLFFSADDGSTGRELWRSDGTETGTVRVKDIRSGSSSSYPGALTNVNGTLFFSADDGTHGTELWQTVIATTLTITNGNNQSTTVSTSFGTPLGVQVLDQFGEPMEGVSVTFTAPSTGASALFGGNNTITVTTDANGQATVNASATTVAGSYTVTATVGSLSASFSLANDPGPLAQLVFKIQPPTAVSVGQRFRGQVQLRDQFGNAVRLPNVAVRIRLQSGSGLIGTLVKRTSANGLATFGDLVLSQAGRYRLVARLGNGLQVLSRVIAVS
jgi:adhesin/invasin